MTISYQRIKALLLASNLMVNISDLVSTALIGSSVDQHFECHTEIVYRMKWNEWCFRPQFCTCKAILGLGQQRLLIRSSYRPNISISIIQTTTKKNPNKRVRCVFAVCAKFGSIVYPSTTNYCKDNHTSRSGEQPWYTGSALDCRSIGRASILANGHDLYRYSCHQPWFPRPCIVLQCIKHLAFIPHKQTAPAYSSKPFHVSQTDAQTALMAYFPHPTLQEKYEYAL